MTNNGTSGVPTKKEEWEMEKRVMIVDDEPDIRMTVSVVLESAGFEVVQIESGARCLEELENGFHGVILMDIMMPDMSGWETVRQIEARNLENGNLIFMLTAKEDPDAELDQLTEMVLDYMRKPFHANELISTVETYCKWLDQAQKAGLTNG